MADELGAELSLSTDDARREIESLRREIEDELGRAVDQFSDDYERAVNSLPEIKPDVDTDAVTSELDRAVQAVDSEIGVTGNVDALQSEIADALASTEPLAVTGNVDPLVAQMEDLFSSFHPQLEPELDTTAVQRALGDLEGAASGLDLGAGFDDAALQGQELADVLADMETQSEETGDGLGAVSNVSTTLATAFSAAKGEGRKLISDLAQIRGGFGTVAAGALALGAGFTALFEAGERSLQSVERAQVVLGEAAGRIEKINVGGLVGSLGELAVKAGVSGGALRNAASSAAQMGLSSGKSTTEVTEFANKVNALALRAVALNPALGDAGSVAERLNTVLARGGRFLARYGIDLTSAEITTRALADSGKTAVRDLTLFERSVAGADIAVEKLGNKLGQDFDRGAATATVRLKSIRAELNSAFASAGKPLVEPTIDAFESLATAGATTSTALGHLAQGVMPVLATGLETLGTTAATASEALAAIPGPALAAVTALVLLDRSTSKVFGGNIRNIQDFRAAVELSMDTVLGRSVVALGALTALDQGLGALGTSAEELGIQFVQTGAAIGFAVGGIQGALIGAGVGAFAQMLASEGDLERATKEVDESFRKAEQSSGDLRTSLFANASSADALAQALTHIDENLANFVETGSAFKGLHLNDDLRRLGLSAGDVADLARKGEEGLSTFIARAQSGGQVIANVGDAIAKTFGQGFDTRLLLSHLDDTNAQLNALSAGTIEAGNAVRRVRDRIDELGVGTGLTGEEFANLNREQQRQILIALRQAGANTDLIVAFQTLQKQIHAADRAQFELFASTNHLSPAITEAAKTASRAADGTIDWVNALRLLSGAARGVIPELGFMTDNAAAAVGEMNRLSTAIDTAAKAVPGLDSALSKGLDTSFFEDLKIPNPFGEGLEPIDVGKFLDTTKLIDSLNETAGATKKFFSDIETIAASGASNTAAALLTLGPDNLGARMAADLAANQPLFREGMEKAFEGIAQGQVAGEAILETLRSRVNTIASVIGTNFGDRLQVAFGQQDITKLTTAQIVAFVNQFGDGGNAAARELVNNFNREVVAEKIAGMDTTPLTDSVEAARQQIVGTAGAIPTDIESALQQKQADIERAAKEAAAKIPQSLQDVQPEVLGGLEQIGNIVATGTRKTKEEYDAEFSQIVGLTSGTMDRAKGAVAFGSHDISDAAARSIQEAIDAQLDNAFNKGAQVGANITYGMAAGIGSDAAARAAQEEIDRQLDALQAEANQHIGAESPAKAFIPTGEYIVQGIALGMERDQSMEFAVRKKFDRMLPHDLQPGRRSGGFGPAPAPPPGVSPIVHVTLDPSMLTPSLDSSITVNGGVHNYGPDIDTRGAALTRHMRSFQHLYAGT